MPAAPDILNVIHDIAAAGAARITAPDAIVVRPDMADAAARIIELALTIEWAGRGLLRALDEEADPYDARRVAIGVLRKARGDLDRMIEELGGRA